MNTLELQKRIHSSSHLNEVDQALRGQAASHRLVSGISSKKMNERRKPGYHAWDFAALKHGAYVVEEFVRADADRILEGIYMGLRINTNISAINAQRQLGAQQKRNSHALAALSSGSRIVNAADDAAGLAISENIRGQIRGMKMARNNAYNAVSLVQTSEGGLNEINNILIRLRELGVQAASDNIGETERGFLATESKQLIQEADRIAKTTRFGSKQLLDGSGGEMEFHVGPFGDENNVIKYSLSANATADALGFDGLSIETKGDAREALGMVDESLLKLGKLRADFGAVQSRMDATVSNLDIQYENLSAANSRLRDADVAYESSELASSNILQQAAVSVMAQANTSQNAALRLLQ